MQLFFGVFMPRDKTLNMMQTMGTGDVLSWLLTGEIQAMNKLLLGDRPKVLKKVAVKVNLKEFVLKK